MSGDMEALRALIERVQVGDRKYVTNHDTSNESRESEVTWAGPETVHSRLLRTVRNQGRTFGTSCYAWPKDGDDFQVDVERRVLRTYRQSYGSRVIALTIAFGTDAPCQFTFCRRCGGYVSGELHTTH